MTSLSPNSVYVGQGTFGCAYRPALDCKRDRPRSRTKKLISKPGLISKIFFDPVSAREELGAHRTIMRELDPRHAFSVRLHRQCDADVGAATVPAAELARCRSGARRCVRKQGRFVQLIYDDGGTDLESLLNRIEEERWSGRRRRDLFRDLWAGAGPIFAGLAGLRRKGWFHGDIKTENIVWGPDLRMRLIDFGGAQSWRRETKTKGRGRVTVRLRTAGTEIFMAPEWWTYLFRQGDWGNRARWGHRASPSDAPATWEEVANILLLETYGDRIPSSRQADIYGPEPDSEDFQITLAPDKLDTYCWGLALLQLFGALVLTSRPSSPAETESEDRILDLLLRMVRRNSSDRLGPAEAYRCYRTLLRSASFLSPLPPQPVPMARGTRGRARDANFVTGRWQMSDRYTNARSSFMASSALSRADRDLVEHLREESAPDVIAELLCGADVRATVPTTFFGHCTPLLIAAGASRPAWSFAVVRLLLDAGAEVNPAGALWSPLHRAVYVGNAAAAVELAARGADLDSRNHPHHWLPAELASVDRADLVEEMRALRPTRHDALVAIHGIVSSTNLDPDLADLVVHYLAAGKMHAGLAPEYCNLFGR